MTSIIRQHIVFNGWVQGVGFRYRARHAAEMYGVTGWVRNDPSGSVTMEVQGTEEQISNVIIAIERGTYIRIEDSAKLLYYRPICHVHILRHGENNEK